MSLRGTAIALAVLLAGAPLFVALEDSGTAATALAAGGGRGSNEGAAGAVGVAGSIEAPPGLAVRRLAAEDLRAADLRGLEALVLDRPTFEAAKGDPDLAGAIQAFATRRPVTVLGATPADLGLAHGGDAPSGPVLATATTVLRVGGTTFQHVAAWDEADPGPAVVLETAAWWDELKERYPRVVHTQAETTDVGWAHRYYTSYSYSSSPYGVVKYRGDWYRYTQDTCGWCDFWVVVMDTSTDPGRSVWGNAWRTDRTWLSSDTDYYRYDHFLSGWKADSLFDVSWITYQLGVGAYYGGPSFVYNSYHSGAEVNPVQHSTNSGGDSFYRIEHAFDYASSAANGGYTSEPAMLIRVDQGGCIKIPYENRADWREYRSDGDRWASTWISSWREVCP